MTHVFVIVQTLPGDYMHFRVLLVVHVALASNEARLINSLNPTLTGSILPVELYTVIRIFST